MVNECLECCRLGSWSAAARRYLQLSNADKTVVIKALTAKTRSDMPDAGFWFVENLLAAVYRIEKDMSP